MKIYWKICRQRYNASTKGLVQELQEKAYTFHIDSNIQGTTGTGVKINMYISRLLIVQVQLSCKNIKYYVKDTLSISYTNLHYLTLFFN